MNTLVGTLSQVLSELQTSGYELVDEPVGEPVGKHMHIDADISNVLVLPTATDLHASKLVTEGKLILQDKVCCEAQIDFAAYANTPVCA